MHTERERKKRERERERESLGHNADVLTTELKREPRNQCRNAVLESTRDLEHSSLQKGHMPQLSSSMPVEGL